MVKTTINKLQDWVVSHKTEAFFLVLILLLASVLRLYRISEYLTFLGDEGRDVIIVRRFLVYGDIFLIGPGTSIGNMYLGPLYYYMMAPPLWLFNYSPVGPAVMVAVLGIITVWFIYFVAREWFGKNAGLIAAFLYAISPTVIIYSRSSWNPNIMPFFALLCVYAIWRVIKTKKLFWLPILGISFAFVLQSHYLGLLLAPALGLFWLYSLYLFKKDRNLKPFLLFTFYMLLIFAALMSPLLIFDSRHGWRNFEALKTFFFERQTTVSARPWNAFPQLWPLFEEISARLMGGKNEAFGRWIAVITLSGFLLSLKQIAKDRKQKLIPFLILIVWFGIALIGLGLYKQEIYDHYYGFFFAAPFILFGGIASIFINKAKIRGWWIVGTVLVFTAYYNFLDNPVRYAPNNQLGRTREVAEKIREEAKGEKFNLAVLAERNYEAAYQYFLERWGVAIIKIDPLNSEETIAKQLFVVCELPREKCDPTNDPKTEVANFGWSKIEEEWEVSGVILYKLVHSQ